MKRHLCQNEAQPSDMKNYYFDVGHLSKAHPPIFGQSLLILKDILAHVTQVCKNHVFHFLIAN